MTDAFPTTLRWHAYRVVPPYRDDPQGKVTQVLWQPGFYDPMAEESETVCDRSWVGYRCLTHDQPWSRGGEFCSDNDRHEIALECGVHGLEAMWPQPIMLMNPEGFDPPLSAAQLAAVEAAWDE
ncbi:hypothetical protein [Pseudonocardia sp. TRM90224]|uniref:hypothetical protein n=1 Tax=Pseudonocardia sp. TRM90224 TaxID=2812678 RepID=UPI001E5C1F01|nr:hypothetical protein [Pseudonocardia sp. TRM90224]